MHERQRYYELRLADQTRVVVAGASGFDAARRYLAAHPGAVVLAWRACPAGGFGGAR